MRHIPRLSTPTSDDSHRKELDEATKQTLDDIREVLGEAAEASPWKDVDMRDRSSRD